MRHSSVVIRASVAAMVVISLGACAATPPSPSPRETPLAASVSASATSSADALASQAPSTTAAPASIPAEAGVVSRIQVGEPVEPRWFAADDQSLWVHEPTSLVRVDLATSAVTGHVPLNWMDYGYVTTGAGAVWQTDYENDTLVRIDPVTESVVARIPVGLQPEGVAVTAGGCGLPTSTVEQSPASIPPPTASSRRSRSVRPGPTGRRS